MVSSLQSTKVVLDFMRLRTCYSRQKYSWNLSYAHCYNAYDCFRAPTMNFQDLQESVRAELQRRVSAGMMTATSLARQTGFKQAHISNFLNKRRALSLEGLDRVLAAQNLSVDELVPLEIDGAAALPIAR